MLHRSREFHKGGIYNLWATRQIAERFRKDIEGKRNWEKIQNKRFGLRLYNKPSLLPDIKYDEPGNTKNLWATNSLTKKIRKTGKKREKE